uniref:Ig-like domain-containing protein n=1 Tax=Lates calcarifer TaxID=8187 RepID=A0A4W6EAN0_LATCA
MLLPGDGGASRVLFLHHMTFCLLLLQPHTVVALLGDNVTRCPAWTRPDLKHVDNKYPSYEGRTSLFVDRLERGDVSLQISRVQLLDEGTYRCFVPRSGYISPVSFLGAVSSPVIRMTKHSRAVVLECESKGWYPEPEVLWLDGEGNLLSAGPTETVRGPDDLYTVSSRVTVEKRHSNSFTCRVQQNKTNQARELSSSVLSWVEISILALGLIAMLLALALQTYLCILRYCTCLFSSCFSGSYTQQFTVVLNHFVFDRLEPAASQPNSVANTLE